MDLKQASIADRTYSCLDSFNGLIHTLETHRKEEHGKDLSLLAVDDQMGRFRLWAGNIGAFKEGRSSLDYRLRDAKFLARNVQRLLDSLQASLIGATRAAGRPAFIWEKSESGTRSIPSDYETSSDSSGSSDLKATVHSELAGHYLATAEIIGRLLKLSIAIRSPSIQNAAARAASFIDKDEYGNDVSALFEEYVLKRIIHHYPELSLRISERLSRAVGRQRRQFMYQRRHREKLGRTRGGTDNFASPEQKMHGDNLKSLHELAVPTSQPQATIVPDPTLFQRSILSETTATQYVPRPEQPQASSTKSFSTASGTVHGSEIYVPPPIYPNKDQEFECPYCFFILSNKFKEVRTWRKHVFDDLQPYSCLFEGCPNPDQSFNRFNDWVYHENWSHNLQWCCDLASHGLQLYETQNALLQHLHEVHNEDAKDAGVCQILERNKRPAPILWTECPFCKFVPELTDISDVAAGFSQDELASNKLVKHIGNHLQAISILALPWRDDLKDYADSKLNESSEARNEARSQLGVPEVEELDRHDELEYELDLRSVMSTEDQRWDMDPGSFQEINLDDPIIRHLMSIQSDHIGKIDYNPLPLDPRAVRVLRLHPGKPDEAINCDLLVISLDSVPLYCYLSYDWGPLDQLERILVNNMPRTVYRNAFTALKAIRHQDSDLMIWVDALCINQDDYEERSSQISLIPQIIQGASETIVWLGPGTGNSDLAMEFVGNYEEFIRQGARNDKIIALRGALDSLFSRKWWSRVWVVQEVLMSRSATVFCGSLSVSFKRFVALRNLRLTLESSPNYLQLIQCAAEMPFGDILLLWDQLKSQILDGTATLFSLTTAMRKLVCVDPRDKVYAPLALYRKNGGDIVADYVKTPCQVYTEAMQHFLKSDKISALYIVEEHTPTNFLDLPSWVIDWSARPVPRIGFRFDGQGARRAYRAEFPFEDFERNDKGKKGLRDDGDRIFREGVLADKIMRIGKSFGSAAADVTTLVSCCREWWKIYQIYYSHDIQVTPEYFWRTLIANRLEDFAEEPSMTFLKGFDRWLEDKGGNLSSLFPENTERHIDDRVEALIKRSCVSRRFAVTANGYPALVPERAQIGDHIVVLLGGDVPFVLRPRAEGNWSLVGESYIHGFMDGEALMPGHIAGNSLQLYTIV